MLRYADSIRLLKIVVGGLFTKFSLVPFSS